MLNFVFIDGADGIGKTTLCENMAMTVDYAGTLMKINSFPEDSIHVKAYVERVPSGSGALAFMRDLLKDEDFKCDEFARQMMHACDNIKTYISVANNMHLAELSLTPKQRYVFFDRGPMSNVVYGSAIFKKTYKDNVEIYQYIKILFNTNLNVLDELINKRIIDKVFYVNLFKEHPFRKDSDGSYYEEHVDFKSINETYKKYSNTLASIYHEYNDLHKSVKIINLDIDELNKAGKLESKSIAEHIWKQLLFKCY